MAGRTQSKVNSNLSFALLVVAAAIAMTRGAMTYECYCQDNEGAVHIIRSRREEVHFIWRETEPELRRVDSREFACLLLRKGMKLYYLSKVMLSDLERQLELPDLSKKELKALRVRVTHIQGWNLKQITADLELLLQLPPAAPTLERLWHDVVDLMQDYPPTITDGVGVHKERPIRLVTLKWEGLPEHEGVYVAAFAKAVRKQPVTWQNPFGKGTWKHYLEDFVSEGDRLTLALRVAQGR